jgi:hypothetical protein
MRRLLLLGALGLIGLVSATSFVSAQFAPIAPPPPSGTLPLPQPMPEPPPPVVVPVRPLTVNEFAASFKPLPGTYEVLLIHPKTGCPVKVCFTLPPGCIRKVRVNGHKIEFVYKCQRDVVIRFLHNGKVWVRG